MSVHGPVPDTVPLRVAAKGIGVSLRSADYWYRQGYLPEPVVPASGSGSVRWLDGRDVARLALAARLVTGGVAPDRACEAALVALEDGDPLAQWLVVPSSGLPVRTWCPLEVVKRGGGAGAVLFLGKDVARGVALPPTDG